MKKILCLILTLVCIATAFCGCNLLDKQAVTLEDNIVITQNTENNNPSETVSAGEQTTSQANETTSLVGELSRIYETAESSHYVSETSTGSEEAETQDYTTEQSRSNAVTSTSKSASVSHKAAKQTTAAPTKTTVAPTKKYKPQKPNTAITTNKSQSGSESKGNKKDKYKTDPVPSGKPLPSEPESQKVDKKKTYTCTFSIECSTILNNLSDLEADKLDILPSNGVIFPAQTVNFYEGESVYDVLQRICKERHIHMESSWTPMYNSAYVEGIGNLYEFDCGSGSGWMYRVNGWYPNYGCSRYQLKQGERVEWRYTCDLGKDIGGSNAIGG